MVESELNIQDKIAVAETESSMRSFIASGVTALTLLCAYAAYREGFNGQTTAAFAAFSTLTPIVWKMVQNSNAALDDLRKQEAWKEEIYRAL